VKIFRILFVFPVFFTACVLETRPEPPLPARQLSYTARVVIGPTTVLRCSVEIVVLKWPAEERLIFQFPPYYPDNPRMPVPGISIQHVKAEDWLGRNISVREAFPPFQQGRGRWMDLGNARVFRYEVDLDPGNPETFGPPVPGMMSGTQLLDGSQLFALPASGRKLSEHWRNPVSLHLEWLLDAGLSMVGGAYWDFTSNYEMMFFRGALNPVQSKSFLVGEHRVTVYTTSPGVNIDMERFEYDLGRWIRRVERAVKPLPWKKLYIGANSVHAGIEGMAGYWFRPEYSGAAEVHLHELIHSLVGVQQGELEDAWWKEGVTTYLGQLLSAWDGYYDSTDLGSTLLQTREMVPSVRDYALSDPVLRDRFYSELNPDYQDQPGEDFYSLLYGKGAQAAMLLDDWILRSSGGKQDLFAAVRLLYRPGQGGFSRRQFVAVLESLSGMRADTLLQSLCDRPGAFSPSRLQGAFDSLRVRGRFLPKTDSIDIIRVLPRLSGKQRPGDGIHLRPQFKF